MDLSDEWHLVPKHRLSVCLNTTLTNKNIGQDPLSMGGASQKSKLERCTYKHESKIWLTFINSTTDDICKSVCDITTEII